MCICDEYFAFVKEKCDKLVVRIYSWQLYLGHDLNISEKQLGQNEKIAC